MATDFQRLLEALVAARVEFVIVGGLALVLRDGTRITQDLDLCYARDQANLERLAAALGRDRLDRPPVTFPTARHGSNSGRRSVGRREEQIRKVSAGVRCPRPHQARDPRGALTSLRNERCEAWLLGSSRSLFARPVAAAPSRPSGALGVATTGASRTSSRVFGTLRVQAAASACTTQRLCAESSNGPPPLGRGAFAILRSTPPNPTLQAPRASLIHRRLFAIVAFPVEPPRGMYRLARAPERGALGCGCGSDSDSQVRAPGLAGSGGGKATLLDRPAAARRTGGVAPRR